MRRYLLHVDQFIQVRYWKNISHQCVLPTNPGRRLDGYKRATSEPTPPHPCLLGGRSGSDCLRPTASAANSTSSDTRYGERDPGRVSAGGRRLPRRTWDSKKAKAAEAKRDPHRIDERPVRMSMLNKFALDHRARKPRFALPRRIATASALSTAFLLLGLIASSPGASGHQTRVSVGHPPIPGTKLACDHRKIHRFTAEIHPGRCEVAGIAEGEGFVRFPIEGEWERIEWNHWGGFRSQGNEAVNRRTGREVRVIAYRRVRCPDGSTWYSLANMFSLEGSYNAVIRLPVCNDPRLIR